jgi:hypothetical protein
MYRVRRKSPHVESLSAAKAPLDPNLVSNCNSAHGSYAPGCAISRPEHRRDRKSPEFPR